jgi:hypothetical protein
LQLYQTCLACPPASDQNAMKAAVSLHAEVI